MFCSCDGIESSAKRRVYMWECSHVIEAEGDGSFDLDAGPSPEEPAPKAVRKGFLAASRPPPPPPLQRPQPQDDRDEKQLAEDGAGEDESLFEDWEWKKKRGKRWSAGCTGGFTDCMYALC